MCSHAPILINNIPIAKKGPNTALTVGYFLLVLKSLHLKNTENKSLVLTIFKRSIYISCIVLGLSAVGQMLVLPHKLVC